MNHSEFYRNAYAVGYYYGRTFAGAGGRINICELDKCYTTQHLSSAFDAGYAAGERDFQEIDLVAQALACGTENDEQLQKVA